MRSIEECREVLDLWDYGESKKGIARITGIPRATVRDIINRYGSVAGLEAALRENLLKHPDHFPLLDELRDQTDIAESESHRLYAYLLGLYLGDGNISKPPTHRVYRLRITLDKKYPGIIAECKQTLETLFPENQIGIANAPGCVNVSLYHKNLPLIFPQHGEGPKHERKIELEPWQQRIVDTFPLAFWRGLYHSDGSRSQNIVNGKDYPRYQFHNFSPEIRRIFCDACDALGIHWTIASKRNVSIAGREDVERLDRLVGAKA